MNPIASRKPGLTEVGPTELMHSSFAIAPSINIPTSRQSKKNKNATVDNAAKSPPGSSKVQHVPCKFFKNGACTAGKNCVFSHIKENVPSASVCKYYVKGNCKFGNKCALQHGNEKKPSSRNGLKSKSQNQFSSDRLRQGLDQRSLIDFGKEVEMLSRSLSRTNMDFNYNANSLPGSNGLNFYTPQLKTSQLSNIFSSPNQSQFFMNLPNQPFSNSEDKFSTGNQFAKQGASPFSERLRTNEFPSPNFNFGFSDEHDLLPSSLDELLTPTELQMRKTKASMLSRPGFMNRTPGQESSNLTSAAPRFLNNYENGFSSSSLPSISSLGITEHRGLPDIGNHAAPSNSLMTHSFNSEGLFSVDAAEMTEEGKDDSGLSQTSDTKKDDNTISIASDDEVPFPMEGDF